MVHALKNAPNIITLEGDEPQLNTTVAKKALEEFWKNFAVSTFDFRQVVEAAENNAVPVTTADVRTILHEVEEGVVSVDHDALDEGVRDYAARFNWYRDDDEEPIDYTAYSLKTCDWLIVCERTGVAPDNELPGWTKLQNGKIVRVVDAEKTLDAAILTAKSHDDAEKEFSADLDRESSLPDLFKMAFSKLLPARTYSIYPVYSFNPQGENAVHELELVEKEEPIFDSAISSYPGFGGLTIKLVLSALDSPHFQLLEAESLRKAWDDVIGDPSSGWGFPPKQAE